MTKYFYLDNNLARGPLSLEEVKYLIDRGTLTPEHLVRDEGTSEWSRAGTFKNLFNSTSSANTAPKDKVKVEEKNDKQDSISSNPVPVRKRSKTQDTDSKTPDSLTPPPLPKSNQKVNPFFIVFIVLSILLFLTLFLFFGKGNSLLKPASDYVISEKSDGGNSDTGKNENDSPVVTSQPVNNTTGSKKSVEAPSTPEQENTPSIQEEVEENQKEPDISTNTPTQNLVNDWTFNGNEENESSNSGGANINNFLPESSFFGINLEGKSFVFIVDCSTSMAGNNKFIDVKKETIRSIESLSPKQQFSVIFFSDSYYPVPYGKKLKLLKASKKNISNISDSINDQSVVGGTEPLEAILQAINLKPSAIYFLTDGGFSASIPAEVKIHNTNNIPIHCICFKDLAGQLQMKQISQESGGTFRHVP